ncbi:MAG: hypothetical protein ACXV8J_02480 [Methylobacter sp.]
MHTSGYLLRQAIILFIDFTVQYNKLNPSSLHINSFQKINAEVFNAFQKFLKKQNKSYLIAERFKTALLQVAQESQHLPIPQLPTIMRPRKKNKTEPLNKDTFAELTNALMEHIDKLYVKIEFRKKVAESEPYHYNDLLSELFPEHNRTNIFRWYQYYLSRGKCMETERIVKMLCKSTDTELLELSSDPECLLKFKKLYANKGGSYLLAEPLNPFESFGIRQWVPNNARSLNTMITHDYPFGIALDTLEQEYGHQGIQNFSKQCNNIVKVLLHRFVWCNCYHRIRYRTPLLDDLLELYYPTMTDMAAIVIFIMLQTGWNKETVLAINGDDFEHILTGTINKTQMLIYSEKNRSQGKNKPFFAPKEFIALSNKTDKYSIYNLIILAKELSSSLVDKTFDYIPCTQEQETLNPLYLCIRYWADWVNKGGRHTSIANNKAFQTGIRNFLTTYPIMEKNRRMVSASDFTSRLRPTWIKYHRKNNPLSLIAMQQGHSTPDTTDIYYDSSGPAMQDRRERLRSELEAVVDLLRRREFAGLLGKSAQRIAETPMKIFHIPGKKKSLWGCADQFNPDWVGADRRIDKGQKCYSIQNCLFCSQVRIFEDSLPYLMERLSHVQELLDEREETDYSSQLGNEKEVIEFILDEWGDELALKEAVRYRRRNYPLLPRDLASLRVIFEDKDKYEAF